MSLLQVAVGPSRTWARIAVDTILSDAPRHVSKLHALPHLRAIVGARGVHLMCCAVASAANMGLTLDELLSGMPTILAEQAKQLAPVLRDSGVPSHWVGREPNVALIGWRPEGLVARVWNGFHDPRFAIHDVPAGSAYASPCYALDDPMHCQTIEDMERVAREQVKYAKELNDPDIAIGGSLLVATVTRSEIRIETVCNLDEPARSRPLVSFSVASA
jgi:hypothetical protein